MSVSEFTLHSSDLRSGLALMAGLLVALAVVTAAVWREHGLGARGALRAQVTSWWVLLPPVFAAWAAHPVGEAVLVLVIAGLAAWELGRLASTRTVRGVRIALGLGVVVQAAFLATDRAAVGSGAMLLCSVIAAMWWRADARTPRASSAPLLLALFALQAAGLGCLADVAPVGIDAGTAAAWFLYLCVVTALNDIGQFVLGTAIGRHKLAARISPNKTWQGVGGGLLASVAFSVTAGRTLALAATPRLVALGLALSVAGLLGDLAFSAGKRALGVKDYGRLIPGHGGILDRVDSLVLTAPMLFLLLRLG